MGNKKELVAKLQHSKQQIDVLLNNAAINKPVNKLKDVEFGEFEYQLAVNIIAP